MGRRALITGITGVTGPDGSHLAELMVDADIEQLSRLLGA